MNYERIYNQIIGKAKSENRKKIKGGIYYECHHIIPRCMGGSNDTTNLVLLTAKEHYMAHRLLYNIYPDHAGIYYAMICMIGGWYSKNKRYAPTSRIYERFRSSAICGTRPKEIGIKISNALKGRVLSEETKKRMSESAKKKPLVSIETRRKLSESGKNMSEETKKKISLAKKGIPRSEETRRKITESWKNRKNINIK